MQLGERFILEPLLLPGKFWKWIPPPIPEFAGPSDLLTVLVSYRAKLDEIRKEIGKDLQAIGEISNAGLELLLSLAYKVSFSKDEGRASTARLFVAQRERADSAEQSVARLGT